MLTHLVIEITGHHYLYNTLNRTLFEGRLSPDIREYKTMPNRVIEAGNPDPWPFHPSYNDHALTIEEEAYHQSFGSVAFLIAQDGMLLHESYWDGFNEYDISNSFSMAKSIVGVLTGIAIERGEIKSIDDPVYFYLPQYETEIGKKITIKHLLTMSSGVNFDEHYLNPFAFPARANYGNNLEALLRKYKPVTKPGHQFSYQSGTTQMLGFALMSATRKNLSEYASEHLWKKIGAERDAFWGLDTEDGAEKAFCCINATARDFTRIGELYRNYGNWNRFQVIDSAYVEASVSQAVLLDEDGEANSNYGYSWWLGEHEGECFYYMRGIKGQYVIVIPDRGLVITRLGKRRDHGLRNDFPDDVKHYIEMGLRIANQ